MSLLLHFGGPLDNDEFAKFLHKDEKLLASGSSIPSLIMDASDGTPVFRSISVKK